jgi:hypothetical protein
MCRISAYVNVDTWTEEGVVFLYHANKELSPLILESLLKVVSSKNLFFQNTPINWVLLIGNGNMAKSR